MSTRPSDDRTRRAEARRRARMAARGELPEPEADEPGPAAAPQRPGGGFLRTIFPPAPPLPNRPDPLVGFDPSGPLAPIRERVFLLRRNVVAWLVPGLIVFLTIVAQPFYAGGALELIATFVQFGAIISAGWFGWQRPTLYGTAASLLGFFLGWALTLLLFALRGVGPDAFGGPGTVILNLFYGAVFQAGLGFLGGWYGGYLRRRQTQLSRDVRRRR